MPTAQVEMWLCEVALLLDRILVQYSSVPVHPLEAPAVRFALLLVQAKVVRAVTWRFRPAVHYLPVAGVVTWCLHQEVHLAQLEEISMSMLAMGAALVALLLWRPATLAA
jgi:hypothetical protein